VLTRIIVDIITVAAAIFKKRLIGAIVAAARLIGIDFGTGG
jgi:hypothetical protein